VVLARGVVVGMRAAGLMLLAVAAVCVAGYGLLGWASAACDTNCPTEAELRTYKAMFYSGSGVLLVGVVVAVALLFRKRAPRD
jgi:hypothetical protein